MNHKITPKISFQIFRIGRVIEIHYYFTGEIQKTEKISRHIGKYVTVLDFL